jgi:hypothetical protein
MANVELECKDNTWLPEDARPSLAESAFVLFCSLSCAALLSTTHEHRLLDILCLNLVNELTPIQLLSGRRLHD